MASCKVIRGLSNEKQDEVCKQDGRGGVEAVRVAETLAEAGVEIAGSCKPDGNQALRKKVSILSHCDSNVDVAPKVASSTTSRGTGESDR